jgi:hypothetical protein
MIMGHIFKSTVPDETDEERRELERCVCSEIDPRELNSTLSSPLQDGRRSSIRQSEASPRTRQSPGRSELTAWDPAEGGGARREGKGCRRNLCSLELKLSR